MICFIISVNKQSLKIMSKQAKGIFQVYIKIETGVVYFKSK